VVMKDGRPVHAGRGGLTKNRRKVTEKNKPLQPKDLIEPWMPGTRGWEGGIASDFLPYDIHSSRPWDGHTH